MSWRGRRAMAGKDGIARATAAAGEIARNRVIAFAPTRATPPIAENLSEAFGEQ